MNRRPALELISPTRRATRPCTPRAARLGEILLAVICLAVHHPLRAEDSANAPSVETVIPLLKERLSSLRPENSLSYFLLAEEVMAEIPGDRGIRLARSLLVLAHELDRDSPSPRGLAPGVYLALAEIADQPGEREWLLSLAENAGYPMALIRRVRPAPASQSDEGLRLAEAIGLMRAGEGREIRQRLQKESVTPLLEQLTTAHPELRRLLDDAVRQPVCPTCRNNRAVRSTAPRQGAGSEEQYSLCDRCRGNPGPSLSAEQFRLSISAEAELLNAEVRQWSAQVWLDGGLPLREPAAEELASFYGVDRDAVLWRPSAASNDPLDGRWVRP